MGKQIKILSITASPDDVDGADDIFYEQEQDTLLNAFGMEKHCSGWMGNP